MTGPTVRPTRTGPPPRGCFGQVLGFLAAVVGIGFVVIVELVAPRIVERDAVPAPTSWSGSAIVLTTLSDRLQTCLVTASGGPSERVVVPRTTTGRRGSWSGLVVEPLPGSTTALRCSPGVVVTTGPIVGLYPLGAHTWLMLPACALAAIGIVCGRPFAMVPALRRRPRPGRKQP